MESTTEVKIRRKSVFLIPNLIGYIRIALLCVVLGSAFSHPLLAFTSYFIAANLDAVDGYCARKLQQESKIGIILDYAIDRASDVLLFMMVALLYQKLWSFFTALLMLNIFSHICQVYSAVFTKLASHKHIAREQNLLLKLYYTNRPVLYFSCAFHDLWFATLYLHHFYPSQWLVYANLILLPGFAFKVLIHLLQIVAVFRSTA